MSRDIQPANKPTDGIWNRFLLLVPLVLLLMIACFIYIAPRASSYAAWIPDSEDPKLVSVDDIVIADTSVAEVESVYQMQDGTQRVVFKAVSNGLTTATLQREDKTTTWSLRVWRGFLIEHGLNFTGVEAVQVAVIVFIGVLVILFASVVVKLWRTSWYGYTMVAAGGCFLFCLFQFVVFLLVFIIDPAINIRVYLWDIGAMVDGFSVLSIYFMLPLALLVSISNISLIRHEGRRPVNLLGITLSVVWCFVYIALMYIAGSILYLDGSVNLLYYVRDLLSLAIAFGECLLLSTMICAWLAAHHVPTHSFDYLAILGCGIRDDGTPCPLLAGRVDRAVAFDKERQAAGDAPVVFVPSGGQGSDEPISEAQSMGNYLQDMHGIPHERIVLENRSTTTRENMAYTREVIEGHAGRDASELKVGFSTTNYHVFRGYVCAHQAGMTVEGLGSKTKYYFWPNAFLREFAGLLVTRWRAILQTYISIAGIYLVAKFILALADKGM